MQDNNDSNFLEEQNKTEENGHTTSTDVATQSDSAQAVDSVAVASPESSASPDSSTSETTDATNAALNDILAKVKNKDTSLDSCIDLFDEAIKLTNDAISQIDENKLFEMQDTSATLDEK